MEPALEAGMESGGVGGSELLEDVGFAACARTESRAASRSASKRREIAFLASGRSSTMR